MLQRKLTLVEIGGSALPSPSPAAPRYANWFPMPYKAAAVPPVEGVTPNPVADGVLIEWAAVDQEGVIYVIERGPTAQGPWTEIQRTTETRYLYSDGSGQKWWFRITPTVRGKAGAGSTVEATPPTTTADLVEQQEKLAAETLARMRADAAETAARAAAMAQAAQDLLAEATLRQQQYTQAMQGIADEARARADAVLNEKLAREAAISLEQQTRQSEVDSLARQVAEVAAGSGTQFDSRAIWYFDQTVEGWTGNGTPTLVDGWLRPANAAATPWVQSPAALAVDGSAYRFVKLRVKRVGSPTWAGFLQWITPTDQNWNTQKRAAIAEPAWDANGVATVDVQDIAWWPGTVDRIRLQLGAAQTVANYYLIDYVAVGRPTPGASVALVQAETVARTNAIAAEASQRNTLAVQMRGNYTGTDPLQLTAGLAYEELKARVASDNAQVQRINAMEVRMPAGTGGLASSAAVTEEALARVSGDAALAQSINTVNATLPALIVQGSNMVINGGWQSGRDVGWSYSTPSLTVVATEGRAGGACMRADGGAAAVRTAVANGVLPGGRDMDAKPGKKYRYSCWYRTSADFNGSTNNSKLRLATQTSALLGGATPFLPAKSEWTYLGAVYSIPDNTSISALQLSIVTDHTVGTLWVDDVMLEEVTDLVANADGLQALTTTVQNQSGQINAQAGLISALRTDVDGKASNAALQSLQSQVTLQGNDITSLGTAITNVNANLGGTTVYQITSNGSTTLPPTGAPRSTGIRNTNKVSLISPSRSFTLVMIGADNSIGGRQAFDTYGAMSTAAPALIAALQNLAANQYFILFAHDHVGNLQASTHIADLKAAIKGCGGTELNFTRVNGACGYILVGRKDLGEGGGIEVNNPTIPSDRINAWCEYTLAVAAGVPMAVTDTRNIVAQTTANANATTALTGTVTSLQGTVTTLGQSVTSVTAKLDGLRLLGDNLLPNSDFATGLQWWSPGGTPVPVWTATAGDGRPGVTMTKSGTANPQIGPNDGQWMPNRGARRYRAMVRAMSVSGDVSMLLRLQRQNRTTAAQGNDDKRINLTSAFANYSVDFDAVDDTIGLIRLWAYKTVADGVIRVDRIELYDVTDQLAAAAAASGVSALTATVTQQGQQITAQASRIDGVQASVAGKADASVVQEMRVQVKNQGGSGNLLINSTFPFWERNGWGWGNNSGGFTELGNPTNDSQWNPVGVYGIGAMSGNTVSSSTISWFGTEYDIAVEEEKTYCASAWINTHRCLAAIEITYLRRDGTVITNANTGWKVPVGQANVTLGNLPRYFMMLKAPSGAAFAKFRVLVLGNNEASPYIWMFRPMFSQVSDGATQPPEWSAGGLETTAEYKLSVRSGNVIAGMQLASNGSTSELNFLADVVNILSPGAADGFEMTKGYLRVWSGNSQRIIGNNFGADGLVDYFGPNVGAANASKANATMWMDRSGNAYWGGAIAAGILRNAAQSTSIVTTGNSVLVGPFDTNGRNKQVVVGFNRRHRRIKNAQTAQGFVAGAGTNGGTINLYRQLDGQAETLWQQIPITGSVNIFNQPDGPDSADSIWNAALTLNDNANGATRRSYRAEVVSFTEQTVTHQSGSFDSQTITQSLSIVSIEQ